MIGENSRLCSKAFSWREWYLVFESERRALVARSFTWRLLIENCFGDFVRNVFDLFVERVVERSARKEKNEK